MLQWKESRVLWCFYHDGTLCFGYLKQQKTPRHTKKQTLCQHGIFISQGHQPSFKGCSLPSFCTTLLRNWPTGWCAKGAQTLQMRGSEMLSIRQFLFSRRRRQKACSFCRRVGKVTRATLFLSHKQKVCSQIYKGRGLIAQQ